MVRLAFAGEPDAAVQTRLAGQSLDHCGKPGRPIETTGAHAGPGQVSDLEQRTDQDVVSLAWGDRPDAEAFDKLETLGRLSAETTEEKPTNNKPRQQNQQQNPQLKLRTENGMEGETEITEHTHLPDITLVQPVHVGDDERPTFYVANRAHHSDVGGITPGSMPLSNSIYQEGIRIPPLRLVHRGEVLKDVMDLILANVRTPVEREGDLTAQIASNRTGERRLIAMTDRYGVDTVATYMRHLQDYAERMTREAIAAIPDGEYRFEDCMDDDGQGNGPLPIVVTVSIDGDAARIDFTGTCDQVPGSVNAIYAITLSAVMYCFRVIVPFAIPSNRGTIRPLEVIAPEGTLVNARLPAAATSASLIATPALP